MHRMETKNMSVTLTKRRRPRDKRKLGDAIAAASTMRTSSVVGSAAST